MITLAIWIIENIDTISAVMCRGALVLFTISIVWTVWMMTHAPLMEDHQ